MSDRPNPLTPIVDARVAARDTWARADEREQWASWLENWTSAVGPEPPTSQAVIAWLRADSRPFGCSAAEARTQGGA